MQSERSERLRELTPAARRRGLYFIDRCGRSASAVNSRRSLHFVPLCTQTEHSLLAVFTLLTGAALTVMYCKYIPCVIISGSRVIKLPYECRVSRSERLRELRVSARVQGACSLAESKGGAFGGGAGVQWTPLSRRLRSADRAGRRDLGQSPSRRSASILCIIPCFSCPRVSYERYGKTDGILHFLAQKSRGIFSLVLRRFDNKLVVYLQYQP